MRYSSADGLMTSSDPAAVATWDGITARHELQGANWKEHLRALGVKLAHPDDGWVTRDAAEPYLSVSWYPLFDDHPEAGDLIALGYHYDEHWEGGYHYRLCRVTRAERNYRLIRTEYLYYEDTGVRLGADGQPVNTRSRAYRRRQKQLRKAKAKRSAS